MLDDNLLTLKEVCERTGWDYERLRPYLEGTGFNEAVGAQPKKGTRGLGYPLSSLAYFEKLKSDADPANRKVTPKTLRSWIADLTIQTSGLVAQSHREAIVPSAQLPVQALIGALERLHDSLQNRLPPLEDKWLNEEQAFALLQCSPRRRVRQIVPGVWSYLEIQEYMRKRREGKG